MHWLWVGTFSRIDNKVCSEKAMSFCSRKYFQTHLFYVPDEKILANYSSLRISERYYVINIEDILNAFVSLIPFLVFGFWFLVTFGDKVTKIRKYYVIFVYILQGKMGKTENNGKKITQLKWPKYQKPKDENMGWTIRSLYSLGG